MLTGEAEGAITLADLREPRRRRPVTRRPRADRGRRSRGHGHDRLHVRHHRARRRAACSPTRTCCTRRARTSTAWSCATTPPVIFQYLPLAHVLARMVSFVTLDTGGDAGVLGRGHEESRRADIAEAEPTHIPTVPRLLEKIHTRVISAAEARGRREGRDLQARAARPARRWPRPSARAARSARSTRPGTRSGDKLALSQGPRRARPEQPGPDHRRRADRRRGDRVLLRLRRARARGLRHDRDVRGGDAEHVARGPGRLRRAPAGRRGGLARRRRRDPRTRPARLQGLPPQRRSHRAAIIEGRLAAHRRPRRDRSTATCASRAARRT